MVSYWKLDEASGSRADSYGSNTLTPTNTPGSAVGKLGNASTHVYASLQYLEAASNATLQLGDSSFSLTAWVRIGEKTNPHIIVSKDGPSSGQREFSLYFDHVENAFCGLVFRATDSTVAVAASNFGSPTINTWYFLHLYHDAGTDTIGISVNNGTANTQATGGSLQAASNGPFQIGGSARFPSQYQMDGMVDSVGYWKRVLTGTEVSNLYNAGSGLEYPF